LALPKSLGPREKDKLVFREFGEIIAMREDNKKPVKVLASRHAVALVSFYANLNFRGAVCPVSDELSFH
jgi:urease gamma subunit